MSGNSPAFYSSTIPTDLGTFLAALAITGADQVTAAQFILDEYPQPREALEGFVRTLSNIQPELVDHAITTPSNELTRLLISRHRDLDPASRTRLLDTEVPELVSAIVVHGAVEFVPASRLSHYATHSPETARALFETSRVTTEHLSAAIEGLYTSRDGLLPFIPTETFSHLVEQLGLSPLTDCIADASFTLWWVPLTYHHGYSPEIMANLFDRVFFDVAAHASIPGASKAEHYLPISAIFTQVSEIIALASPYYPTTLDRSVASSSIFVTGSGPSTLLDWVNSPEFRSDHLTCLDAVAPTVFHGTGSSVLREDFSREDWLHAATSIELVAEFLAGTLSDTDLAEIVSSGTLHRLVFGLTKRPDHPDTVVELYQRLGGYPDTYDVDNARLTLAGAMRFDDQLRLLPISTLIELVEPEELRDWWTQLDSRVSLATVLALAVNDPAFAAILDVASE